MEDNLIETELLEPPMNLSPRGDSSKEDDEEKRVIVSDEGKDEEDKGGGLISHLISNLVSPLSPKPEKFTEQTVGAFEPENGVSKTEEDVGGGGGANCGGHKQGKTEEDGGGGVGGGGGGGIIGNLVSHLPSSLSDDAAPTTDEASILLHCIIHD